MKTNHLVEPWAKNGMPPASRTSAVKLVAAALTAAIVLILLLGTPAQAVSYRHFKTLGAGLCLRVNPADGFDVRANSCSTTPTTRRDWQVITAGSLNGHPLWRLRNRATGKCLVRGDNGAEGYIFHGACSLTMGNDRWEVFFVSSTQVLLKSNGAWIQRGRHGCLKYLAVGGYANTDIRRCDLNSSLQRWNP
ncbi:hypothetical protein ACQP2F_14830 [Actinoplanes sp. CA-030573]|uniref:hypothetical protein n=1 Tax=Actinoplanes sp. CA-030573 TaxID=3239898 RepID=UPI003D8ECEAE